MTLFSEEAPHTAGRVSVSTSTLDSILTAQIVVAWAGESGDEPRLGWWRTDLVSEYGGEDLFERMLPHTWRWAVLQAVREAARRHDAALRERDHNPDRFLSLFNLGFELDERLDERLRDLVAEGRKPTTALPELADVMQPPWSSERLAAWVEGHAPADHAPAPVGRRMKNSPPADPEALVSQLVAALSPLGDEYPLPHFKRAE